MESNQTVSLYVTFVEKEGPFLKIWGQTEKNSAIYVEQVLAGASQHFDMGIGKVEPEALQPGTLVCAKYKDNKYYRARIINMCIQDTFVEVCFVDFGNKDIVCSQNVRSFQNFPTSFISIPPLAIGFIFAEAHCVGGGLWDERVFENISKEIKYREVQCQLLIQATQYFLVKIYVDGTDLCAVLIQRALMQPITLQAQQAVLLSMSMQKQMIQQQVPPAQTTTSTINTYKACTLEAGCQYQVYVSYVNDGPCQFSVQLKQSEDVLAKLMNDINTLALRLLEDLPIPGTICLAKCQEDDSVCRAVVTNEVDNQFKVFYVDFGNYEVVPFDALYQIPFKYVIPKVMAIRYALDGVDKSTLTIEMQLAFKKFVDNRLLHMKVLPTPTRMAIPKCELWDPETKTSALDVVNLAAQHAYPEPTPLTRGFSQKVKVSFVYSCNRFYVQLLSKEIELSNLMTELQVICQMNEPLDPSVMKPGLPCCALFEVDQLWYRSQIESIVSDRVQVRYIDYGNEEDVHSLQLKGIEGEQLTVLRPQAIECCLNGYQNMEEDAERNALLEEIILEGTFTMKVVDMLEKKALVDLYDDSNYNVASLLLDKIAAVKSQVSPMLVQAGSKIEQRKNYSPKEYQNNSREQNFRGDRERNTGRETNSWNDRTNDQGDKSWRQNNRENRNFDNSNDGKEEGSWRQNNKGFSPSKQRFDSRENSQQQDSWETETSQPVSSDGWNNTNSNTVVNDEHTPTNETGYKNDRRQNDYGRNKGFDREDRGDRFDGKHSDGGYRKKTDFRGGSDSDSEKGFHKGPRTSSRNDRGNRYEKTYEAKPRHSSFDDKSAAEDSWNVSAVATPIDAAPVTAAFLPCEVVGTEATVSVSWFHNPGLFYCQIIEQQDQFKTLMEEIQQFYKNRKPEVSVAGAPVVGLFPEDNVLYRAQVLQVIGGQYKIFFVDFGNVSTTGKVWPIEKRFMTMPAQAIACGMHGVTAAQENWGDPDAYGGYFDKQSFVCRFVEQVEEKILVNIFHESEDIAQQLVGAGLAVSTQLALPEIEMPLLVGQQLRATLLSVNNLTDIIIVLECGLAVTCAAHNLETAAETFEDTLKELLQQTVIVYVDNVIDDKLEVTFYDTEGNKHVILNPDEGAYEEVDRLCPMPVLRSTLTGYVSAADATAVYLQPPEYSDLLAYLLDQLFETYDGKAQESPIVPEEGLIYAIHSSDGNWYRGRVTGFDDESAAVCYVDYGNAESVGFAEIRELDAKFTDICTLSLQVFVSDAESFLDQYVSATISYGENGWDGVLTVLESTTVETVEQEEGSGDTGFASTSLEKPDAAESDQSTPRAEAIQEVAVEADESTQSLPIIGQPVYASHVDSPNEFYLQFSESLNAIEDLQAELQDGAVEMAVLENPATGMLCAAPYSVDQQWYRAEILDADDDITTVRFVDFGNTDVIDNKTTQIKTLSSKLLSLALYATKCSLKVLPKDEEWSSTQLEVFERLAMTDNLSAEFLDQDEKTSYVELYSDGINVREGLLGQNLALPMPETSVQPKLTTGFVSHLNSPSEFWMQLENCVDELEWIAEQLSAAETFPELEDLTPGTLCAALFPDDQMWYRARILSNTVAGIELLFIDYGNSSTSASLRQLPEDLVATAPLAQKCTLQRPEGMSVWTPEACAKFNEISLDGQTVFVVKKIATDETSTVQLLLNERDVSTMLLPATEDGYVKQVETLRSLRVEKASGEVVEGELALEPMPGQVWTEEVVEKFEELNEQGRTLFQIEFVNESTIRLYLNGQDIRPQLGGIRNASFDDAQTENDQTIQVTETTEITEVATEDADKDTAELVSDVNEFVQDLQTDVFNKIDQIISTEADSSGLQQKPETIEDESSTISTKVEQKHETIEDESSTISTKIDSSSLEHKPETIEDESSTISTKVDSSSLEQKPETIEDESSTISTKVDRSGLEQKAETIEDESSTKVDNSSLEQKPKTIEDESSTISTKVDSSGLEQKPETIEDESSTISTKIDSSGLEQKPETIEDESSTKVDNSGLEQKPKTIEYESSTISTKVDTSGLEQKPETIEDESSTISTKVEQKHETIEDESSTISTKIDSSSLEQKPESIEDEFSTISTKVDSSGLEQKPKTIEIKSSTILAEIDSSGLEQKPETIQEDSSFGKKLSPIIDGDAEKSLLLETGAECLEESQEHEPIMPSGDVDDISLPNPAVAIVVETPKLELEPEEQLEEKVAASQDAEQEVAVTSSEAASDLGSHPKCDDNQTNSVDPEDVKESSNIGLELNDLAENIMGPVEIAEDVEEKKGIQSTDEKSPESPDTQIPEPVMLTSDLSKKELEPEHQKEELVYLQDSSQPHEDVEQKVKVSQDQSILTKTEEILGVEESDCSLETARALEKSKIDDQEKDLIQKIESLAAKKLPASTSLTRKSSSPSKVPSPKKTIENSSPTKESLKKESPKKVSTKVSPSKVSLSSPVKVSPKKESPNKEPPLKVSPKRQSSMSPKTSPPREEATKPKQVSPKNNATNLKDSTSLGSEKTVSPEEISTEIDKQAAEISEISPDKESAGVGEQLADRKELTEDEETVPATLTENKSEVEVLLKSELEKIEVLSRPHSSGYEKILFDEKIVPACLSRPETPSQDDREEKNEPERRPESASSQKIKHDDKIVSAAISRPHTPVDHDAEDLRISE